MGERFLNIINEMAEILNLKASSSHPLGCVIYPK